MDRLPLAVVAERLKKAAYIRSLGAWTIGLCVSDLVNRGPRVKTREGVAVLASTYANGSENGSKTPQHRRASQLFAQACA